MPSSSEASLLIVRLGAMGDILHTLPAASSLRRSFPQHRLAWLVKPKWMPLLEGNPDVDELIPFDRGSVAGLMDSMRKLRGMRPELAFDFQGLLQSAVAGRWASPRQFWGFSKQIAREPLASLFYTHRATPEGPHRIERNLQLVGMAGAKVITDAAWIPPGRAEGELPGQPFVLANPFAGWAGKQWPLARYEELGACLQAEGLPLVLNVSPQQAAQLTQLRHCRMYVSSLYGLIDATRRAAAVIGVDSGPVHLAAALGKPGVAIYGPTDPSTNGPYGGSMLVLRSPEAVTTYRRSQTFDASMHAFSAQAVLEALHRSIELRPDGAVVRP